MTDQALIEEFRRRELDRARRLLRKGVGTREVLESMTRRLTAKLLHTPTKLIYNNGIPAEPR